VPRALDLVRELAALVEPRGVASEVALSFPYTAALVEGRLGVASTVLEPREKGYEPGTLSGSRAEDLLRLLESPLGPDSSVGLAVLNALVERPEGAVEADALDLAEVRDGDIVGVVGSFPPGYLARLERRASRVYVFERPPLCRGELPDWAEQLILPECDVVLVTGTTVVNKTVAAVLEACSSAREVVLVGPSVPLIPEPFASRGVTVLAGVDGVEPARALAVVREGGGTRALLRHAVKLAVRLRR